MLGFARYAVVLLSLSVGLTASAQTAPSTAKRLKLRVALAPLEWKENWGVPVEFQNGFDEKLEKKLLDTGRFIVLEREAMQALLQEKSIKEDNTGQSQKGKIVPAEALIKGKVTDFAMNSSGGGGGINVLGIGRVGGHESEAKCGINVRLFTVDTSELIASENASGTASSVGVHFSGNYKTDYADFGAFQNSPLGSATTKAIDQAVDKILKKLSDRPWSAKVADFDASGKEITMNAGSDAGVQVGDVFDIYKVGRVIKDPDTGEVLSVRTVRTGQIKITEVEKKIAIGTVTEGTEFNPGDIVREIKAT